jgi:hypothetical protein
MQHTCTVIVGVQAIQGNSSKVQNMKMYVDFSSCQEADTDVHFHCHRCP